jgi:uncharacterized repeat protein (TIGR04076 family)
MADTPKGFNEFKAEVIAVKGDCEAGHRIGDVLTLSCWKAGGLCGFFYHDIFPCLQTMQLGGVIPWAPDGELTLECPDRHKAVTIKVSAKP